jgi:hypothetical protein
VIHCVFPAVPLVARIESRGGSIRRRDAHSSGVLLPLLLMRSNAANRAQLRSTPYVPTSFSELGGGAGALLHDRLPSVTTNVTRQNFRKWEPAAGTSTLRAAHRTWRRLLVADFLPDSGHSRSITCSRCMRWPGSKDSSLTRLAAFLSRHASDSIYLEPTLTRKLPSNQIRIAPGLSSLSAWDCLASSKPAGEPILSLLG